MLEFFKLPYELGALSPIISVETIDFHYNKHHRTYFDNLVKLIDSSDWKDKKLEEIIKLSYGDDNYKNIFNNSAQVFNHNFYWNSLSPDKIEASDFLKTELTKYFSSWDKFKEELKMAGLNHFASGWLWLVWQDNKIKIITTANADVPIVHNQVPILVIDLWEHAYYIDYRNRRADYLQAVIDNLINWSSVEINLRKIKDND